MNEYVTNGGWDEVRRNFETLKQTVIDTGGQAIGIRFGTTTLTYTASAVSAQATVDHGLAKTPQFIVGSAASGAKRHAVNYVSGTRDDISFDLISERVDGSVSSGDISVFWLAIG